MSEPIRANFALFNIGKSKPIADPPERATLSRLTISKLHSPHQKLPSKCGLFKASSKFLDNLTPFGFTLY
jgi:hypothetical protein